MFPYEIVTDRLSLRSVYESVQPMELYDICSDETDEVAQFVSWSPHRTPRESAQVLDGLEQDWEDRSQASYGVYERGPEGELMGLCTLEFDWSKNRAELDVWLKEEFRSENYSAEGALALIEVAFDVYDVDVVLTRVAEPNEEYRGVVEKYMSVIGGKQFGTLPSDVWAGTEVYSSVIYGVTQEDYHDTFDTDNDSVLVELVSAEPDA